MTPDHRQHESSAPVLPEIPHWICLCLLAAFVLLLLGNVLFVNTHNVLSNGQMDLAHYFVYWRYFGFHELKSGNLALWNPHYYSGVPFFGDFQSALLYPLNFLYLIAPLDAALNWTIALHVFLGGVFMFYWVRHRGLHSLACLLSAMMFMFCGPHFLQIEAGHLPNLCTLIWVPLLFLAIDRMMDRPGLGPCLFGMFVITMAILAGHPQYVFYLGVAAGFYSIFNLIRARERNKIALGLAGMVAGGIALSAIQLFTGVSESHESMRSFGMSYEFASSFSFPPENFLTLVAPWCFGDAKHLEYWGRWYVTEVSLFVSVIGLVLAVYGMARGAKATRRFSIAMLAITLLLAMGGYTPLFHVLYKYAPGFNMFRGMDKFIWLSALFLSMLAGIGLDRLLRGDTVPRWLMWGTVGVAALVGILAFWPGQLEWWVGVLLHIQTDQMPFMTATVYTDPAFIGRIRPPFVRGLLTGAGCLILAAGLFAIPKSQRRLACVGMIVMAVIELGAFAFVSLQTFRIKPPYSPQITEFLQEHPGDYRIRTENANSAMTAGTLDIGGDDPSGLWRYIRYLYSSYGIDFNKPFINEAANKYHTREWRMLRCRYVIMESKGSYLTVKNPLPRFLLVDHYLVMTNFPQIFSTLTATNFPLEQAVILESDPDPVPVPQAGSDKGSVSLLDSSTDYATIEADVKAPCLLFVTDAYSSGWRAVSLPGSIQENYQVMPANFCLRAIPLQAGHHLLRMEYSPPGFRMGRAVSLAAWPIFIVLTIWAWRRSVRSPSATSC